MSRPSPRNEARISQEAESIDDEARQSSYRLERLGPASRADLMITSRARRSTAGNKLKALLDQELEKDEIFAEVENDVEFHADENEGIDIVDSDFDRDSDDNAAPGAEDDESEGERELEAREKAESKKRRAQAKNVGIVKRPIQPPVARKPKQLDQVGKDAKRRHITFALDQDDSQASSSALPIGSRRSSARSSTVQSKMKVESRLSEAEQRRAALPVKAAPRKKASLTQDALIAEALEVEEENRESLRKFLELEEARQARMRQRKDRIVGPFVRWVSVGFKTQVIEQVVNATTQEKPQPQEQIDLSPDAASTNHSSKLTKDGQKEASELVHDKPPAQTSENSDPAPVTLPSNEPTESPIQANQSNPAASSLPKLPARPSLSQEPVAVPSTSALPSLTLDPVLQARKEAASLRTKAVATSPTKSSSVSRIQKHELQARTLLSVEKMPDNWDWLDEFNALLGTHCDWQSYPFVPARNRPPKPRQSICPITGLPAIYKCPRTGIPYANAQAYAVITKLLKHNYIWTGGNHQVDTASRKGKRKERPDGLETGVGTIGSGAAPPEMGIYVDSELEGGPAKVWDTAREKQPAATRRQARTNVKPQGRTTSSVGRKSAGSDKKIRTTSQQTPTPAREAPLPPPPQAKKPRFEVVLTNALAPGDEASVMAAALNLPAGSTRSGRRVHRPE